MTLKQVNSFVDGAAVARKVAVEVGIDPADVIASVLPADKADWLRQEVPALMAGVAQLTVPLLAEVGVGANWEQAH